MNPLPVTEAEFTVTAAAPVEVKVIDCVDGVPTFMLPKLTVEALIVSMGSDAPKFRTKVADTPPALAVSVTVCAEVTEDIAEVKLAVFAPAKTVTVAGTVAAPLLLATPIANPPVAAAVFSVIVQLSVPAPVIEPLVQLRPVSTGIPVPVRLTVEVVPVEELLLMVSVPVAEPAAVGVNCTVNVAV